MNQLLICKMFSNIKLCLVLASSLYMCLVNCDLTLNQANYENAMNKSAKYLENARKEYMIPGIVAGININGTTIWSEAFGLIDIENNVKNRVDSVWRMASISKSFTSALIGRLIDEGRLDLDKSVNEYLKPSVFPIKQWNNTNVKLTLGQVMSHTAGLHVSDFPNDYLKQLIFKNVTDTIRQYKDEPLAFEPGTHFNYSNYGFQVVGAIIESVLNETYENAINKMFKEFEMNSTFCERHEQIIAHRTRYYMLDSELLGTTHNEKPKLVNTLINDDLVSFEANWPSGGILSNVDDLLKFGSLMIKWSKGMNDSKLPFNLNEKTVGKLWSPVFKMDSGLPTDKNTYTYAHGWYYITFENPIVCTKCKTSPIKQVITHSGGLMGVTTYLVLSPENDIALSIFINRAAPQQIIDFVIDLLKFFVE